MFVYYWYEVCSIECENVQYWNLKCFVFNQQKLMEWEHNLKHANKNVILLD